MADLSQFPDTLPIKDLDREASAYTENKAYWQKLRLMYKLGESFPASMFLQKLPHEANDVFLWRCNIAAPTPFLSSCTAYYKGAFFSRDVEVKIDGVSIGIDEEAFRQDIDGAGNGVKPFLEKLFSSDNSNLLLNRYAFVLIDRAVVEEDVLSLAAQTTSGALQPRLVLYHPLQVINWSLEESDQFKWVMVKTCREENQFPKAPIKYDVWTYYDDTNWIRYEAQIKDAGGISSGQQTTTARKVGEGVHATAGSNECPMLRLDIGEDLWFANASWNIVLAHLNLDNLLQAALSENNRPIPVYTGTDKPETPSGGGWSAITLPDSNSKAFYLEMSGTTIGAMQTRCTEMYEQVYNAWHRKNQGKSSHATASASSGASKREDDRPAAAVLDSLGEAITKFFARVIKLATGATDVTVNGFDFRPQSTVEDSAAVLAAKEACPGSPTFHRILERDLFSKTCPNASEGDSTKVFQEIETAPSVADQQALRSQQIVDAGLNRSLGRAAQGLNLPGGGDAA